MQNKFSNLRVKISSIFIVAKTLYTFDTQFTKRGESEGNFIRANVVTPI